MGENILVLKHRQIGMEKYFWDKQFNDNKFFNNDTINMIEPKKTENIFFEIASREI